MKLTSHSKIEYTETEIATKFGQFNIRVYSGMPGQETVVLWTKDLSKNQPALVRVHSECLTGDVLGSHQCDCGSQLEKSLKLISENGGVFIYLRQEGRGIGLFEKIKAYKLQREGHDTIEANTILGHPPDLRTYEMAVTALNDLDIHEIRLITNNPSKISEVAKLGITVVEQVPIHIRPNKFNKNYLETKKTKFQHHFNGLISKYFYQFHIENSTQLSNICQSLIQNNRDPQQTLLAGVAGNKSVIDGKQFANKLKSIEIECKRNDIDYCLHYSFSKEENILETLDKIRVNFPSLKKLHLNDLQVLRFEDLKKACESFEVYLPVSDDQFDVFKDSRYRAIIKKYSVFILLDNSKGNGLKDSFDSFKKRIETLLGHGINNIALCGGFGPNELSEYFELRRYFKVNFSIDAESKLMTNEVVDEGKAVSYLEQLIRFDDPNFSGVEQTQKILDNAHCEQSSNFLIQGYNFKINPQVFNPIVFPSTTWFAEELVRYIGSRSCSFCEVGCGSGVISCLVALNNPKCSVVSTDISQHASQNTLQNVKKLKISDQVRVYNGDVFDGIKGGCKFDVIFWALPFGFLDPGTEINMQETQVFDPGYYAIQKFFETAHKFLNPNGKLLLGFSTQLGHRILLETIAKENGIDLTTLTTIDLEESETICFELLEGRKHTKSI